MALVRNHPNSAYAHWRMKIGYMTDFSNMAKQSQESPLGVKDGVNRTFTLEKTPVPQTEIVYKDGMTMIRDIDYTIDYENQTIVFSEDQIPQPASTLAVSYNYLKGRS